MGDGVAAVIAGADAVSTTLVAPLSEGGGSSSAGCFSGVVVGDSVTLAVVGAGVGANVLFLQSRSNLCLGAGMDMVTSDLIMRFGVALGLRDVGMDWR